MRKAIPNIWLAMLMFFMMIVCNAVQATIFVDNDAPNDPEPNNPDISDPLEDGSEEHPFDALQEAIDIAFDGDMIVVLIGEYTGEGNREISFSKAITVRSTEPNDHNVVAATIINCQGEGRGFYFHATGTSNQLISGLTIINGFGYYGGGIYCYRSSPTLNNCTLNHNSAYSQSGGGMYNLDSSPILNNCTFSNNSAGSLGGGMNNEWSSPTLFNCTFSNNESDAGGGMYNWRSNPTLTSCTFSDNMAIPAGFGGGIFNNNSNPTVTNCTFSNNSAGRGAGMYNGSSNPMLTNCTFSNNSLGGLYLGDGGGMSNFNSSPTLTNCIFSNNSTATYCIGGGMSNKVCSNPSLTNCTFSNNLAGIDGGGMYNCDSSKPTMTNCILWGNIPQELYNEGNSSPLITYTDVKGGWAGEGNIDIDPLFVDVANGDYHILSDSPCIDAGDNNSLPPDTTDLDGDGNRTEPIPFDLDGNTRIVNATVDMGAFEATLLDPVQLIADLAQTVIDLNLHHGIENSLDGKLDAALKALEDINENNNVAAINSLEALINSIEAQRGNKIPEADADALITDVLKIINLLSTN